MVAEDYIIIAIIATILNVVFQLIYRKLVGIWPYGNLEKDELIHVWNFRVKDTSKTPDRLGEYPDVTGRWEYWKTKEGIQMIYSGKRSGKWLTYNEAFKISKTLEEYGNADIQNNSDIQK